IDGAEELLDARTPAGEVAVLGAAGADDHHGELPAERPGADDLDVERGEEGVVPLQAEGRRVTAGDGVNRRGGRSEAHLLPGPDGGALDLLTAHAGAVGGAEILDAHVLARDEGEARVTPREALVGDGDVGWIGRLAADNDAGARGERDGGCPL